MKQEKCIFDENKICDNCGECEFCDLDPTKLCDNCGKCIQMNDFVSIKIDSIESPENDSYKNK